jgi:hypothetical protein
MLIAGEVHTGLLRGPDPVTAEQARRLVDLVAGEPVLLSHRPIAYARSPEIPVGVDCGLAGADGVRQVRGVGTVLQRAMVTGGHVVQGSAFTTVVRGSGSARQPWSHYLSRPGLIETMNRTRWEELAAALAAPGSAAGALDLGAMAGRAADQVQRAASRSGPVRLRAPRTRLRWAARFDQAAGVEFLVGTGDLRVLRLSLPEGAECPAAELASVVEDVALHDWLLSTLLEIIGKSAIGVIERRAALQRLLPAIDYLLHLWMPGARGGELGTAVWTALERRPGFTRQWDTLVHRIRDQLSVGAVAALAAAGPR